ncbi:MAG: alpha-hydroxy-acid oxidizing protein [Planctomycetaceae bacterium]|nr:alpha-hydroxy-acid oxidizing protein [Planctomycetaceae bacterium]
MNRRRFAHWLAVYAATSRWHTAQLLRAAEPEKGLAESFEPASVDDFQALAKAKLSPMAYDYITTGSTDQVTLRENVAAFRRLQILPPILAGVAAVDTSTTVLKQRVTMPILIAPVAAQRLYHPEGAKATARAAAALGTIQGVSSSSSNSVEEIAAASTGPKWLQLYPPRDRGVAERLVRRAEKAGYTAIVVTVDLGERKDADRRNRFALPEAMLRKHLLDCGFSIWAEMSYAELIRFNQQAWDTALSWEFFRWLRDRTRLPLLVKGVLRVADAEKAVAIGLDGIVVSNHGGRRLDGMPASITCLPAIAAAVGGKTEILLDSGVRRGTDVLKALALGAKAVLVGRPYAWALGADGERGVHTVMTLLHEEFTAAMHACGCAKVSDISRDLIILPK